MISLRKTLSSLIIVSFVSTSILPANGFAAEGVLNLPAVGTMVALTPKFNPLMLKGVKVHPENPVLFDFIVDLGESGFKADDNLKPQADKLIKYFLASLTTPEKDMWVNLSPYEKDRVIPNDLGDTDMGRDMLAQDYLLKQLSSSLIHPDKELGKAFWSKVYAKAKAQYGSTTIPVNTFNKIWIMADQAKVFVRDNTAFVVSYHLKVLMDEDYLAMQKNLGQTGMNSSNAAASTDKVATMSSGVFRDLVLGEIEKEVNEGESFATLRQIYNAMILATWYKKNLKEALLNQVYSDKGKTAGIDTDDKEIAQKIFKQYVQAYRKGVFNFIKEENDTATGEMIPRKYFSGGVIGFSSKAMTVENKVAGLSIREQRQLTGKLASVTTVTPRPAGAVALGQEPVSVLSAVFKRARVEFDAVDADFSKLNASSKKSNKDLLDLRLRIFKVRQDINLFNIPNNANLVQNYRRREQLNKRGDELWESIGKAMLELEKAGKGKTSAAMNVTSAGTGPRSVDIKVQLENTLQLHRARLERLAGQYTLTPREAGSLLMQISSLEGQINRLNIPQGSRFASLQAERSGLLKEINRIKGEMSGQSGFEASSAAMTVFKGYAEAARNMTIEEIKTDAPQVLNEVSSYLKFARTLRSSFKLNPTDPTKMVAYTAIIANIQDIIALPHMLLDSPQANAVSEELTKLWIDIGNEMEMERVNAIKALVKESGLGSTVEKRMAAGHIVFEDGKPKIENLPPEAWSPYSAEVWAPYLNDSLADLLRKTDITLDAEGRIVLPVKIGDFTTSKVVNLVKPGTPTERLAQFVKIEGDVRKAPEKGLELAQKLEWGAIVTRDDFQRFMQDFMNAMRLMKWVENWESKKKDTAGQKEKFEDLKVKLGLQDMDINVFMARVLARNIPLNVLQQVAEGNMKDGDAFERRGDALLRKGYLRMLSMAGGAASRWKSSLQTLIDKGLIDPKQIPDSLPRALAAFWVGNFVDGGETGVSLMLNNINTMNQNGYKASAAYVLSPYTWKAFMQATQAYFVNQQNKPAISTIAQNSGSAQVLEQGVMTEKDLPGKVLGHGNVRGWVPGIIDALRQGVVVDVTRSADNPFMQLNMTQTKQILGRMSQEGLVHVTLGNWRSIGQAGGGMVDQNGVPNVIDTAIPKEVNSSGFLADRDINIFSAFTNFINNAAVLYAVSSPEDKLVTWAQVQEITFGSEAALRSLQERLEKLTPEQIERFTTNFINLLSSEFVAKKEKIDGVDVSFVQWEQISGMLHGALPNAVQNRQRKEGTEISRNLNMTYVDISADDYTTLYGQNTASVGKYIPTFIEVKGAPDLERSAKDAERALSVLIDRKVFSKTQARSSSAMTTSQAIAFVKSLDAGIDIKMMNEPAAFSVKTVQKTPDIPAAVKSDKINVKVKVLIGQYAGDEYDGEISIEALDGYVNRLERVYSNLQDIEGFNSEIGWLKNLFLTNFKAKLDAMVVQTADATGNLRDGAMITDEWTMNPNIKGQEVQVKIVHGERKDQDRNGMVEVHIFEQGRETLMGTVDLRALLASKEALADIKDSGDTGAFQRAVATLKEMVNPDETIAPIVESVPDLPKDAVIVPLSLGEKKSLVADKIVEIKVNNEQEVVLDFGIFYSQARTDIYSVKILRRKEKENYVWDLDGRASDEVEVLHAIKNLFPDSEAAKYFRIDLTKEGLIRVYKIKRDLVVSIEAKRGAESRVAITTDDFERLAGIESDIGLEEAEIKKMQAQKTAGTFSFTSKAGGGLTDLEQEKFGAIGRLEGRLDKLLKDIAASSDPRAEQIRKDVPGFKARLAQMNRDYGGIFGRTDAAMIQREGGIDLNANNLQLDQDGNIDIKFDPAMMAEFRRGDFTGVTPVIIRVTPLNSVMPLFGLTEADLPQNTQLAGV